MEKETSNIITKNIKNYNNFSYYQYQEIEKKENERIGDLWNNSTSNHIEKDIFNKILGLIKKEVFWVAIPIIFSIFYFTLNIIKLIIKIGNVPQIEALPCFFKNTFF